MWTCGTDQSWQLQAEPPKRTHTHTEENLAPLEELALSKKAAGHTPDIERGGCLPVLCNGYHMLRSWSEVSEEILYTRAE